MNRTKIEWVKNPDGSQGYSWNPITGCLNGCPYCYANKLASGRLSKTYIRNLNIALPHENPRTAFNDPFYPRFWEEKIASMKYFGGKPKGVFVCDMSDLFGIGIPEEWTRRVMQTIRAFNDEFRFYILTKQPQNLAKWSPFPDNCWVGLSVDGTSNAPLHRIYNGLDKAKAVVKFISFEPLLTEAKLDPRDLGWAGIKWLIIGQQTPIRPETMPKIEWVKEIEAAATKASVPVFEKNNLAPLLKRPLRQEMPS